MSRLMEHLNLCAHDECVTLSRSKLSGYRILINQVQFNCWWISLRMHQSLTGYLWHACSSHPATLPIPRRTADRFDALAIIIDMVGAIAYFVARGRFKWLRLGLPTTMEHAELCHWLISSSVLARAPISGKMDSVLRMVRQRRWLIDVPLDGINK